MGKFLCDSTEYYWQRNETQSRTESLGLAAFPCAV